MANKKFLFFLILSCGLTVASGQQTPAPKPPTKTIDGGVVTGKATSLPKPEYPVAALAVRAGGTVFVQVTIDESGRVISASAVSGHPLLRAAAESAAWQATFKPTLLSGEPVKVTGVITYNFIGGEPKLAWANLALFLTMTAKDKWRPDAEALINSYSRSVIAKFPKEKEMLVGLLKTQGENRAEVIDEIFASLESKLSDAQNWQLKFGKAFGEASIECRNQIMNAGYPLDENKLRENLREIGRLANSAPSEVPAEIVSTLRGIADYAEKPDIKSPENLVGLMQSMTEFIKAAASEGK